MHQLALAQCEPFETPENINAFIVPLKAVKEIERTFADSGEVQISILENQLLLADDHATLTTRLVDGDYPKYQEVIPESAEGTAIASKELLLYAARRVALLSNPKSYAICVEIDAEQIQVSVNTPELGEAHETLPVESATGQIRFGIDARLLVETLLHIETESVALEFISEVKPIFFKPVGEEGHVCLVVPMRLAS